MLGKTMQKCTETWCPDGRSRPSLRKKVRSLLTPSFLQKKEPRDGVGMVFGSRGSVSSSSEELAVARTRAGQRNSKMLCRKMSLSFSGLFDKKPALDFIKSRIRRAGSSRVSVHKDRIMQGAKVKSRRIGNAYDLISKGKTKTSTGASRAPARVHINRKKPVMLRPDTKKVEGRHRDVDSKSSELCKKRILMGRKCKPLNPSGSLRYDENGIPMPELLP